MSKESFYVEPSPPPRVGLKGYLTKESADQLWIQDQQGTWIVNAEDVVARGEWAGVSDSQFTGKPGIFYIRDGAEIYDVRRLKIKAMDRPLAIGDRAMVSDVRGASTVQALALERFGDLQLLNADAGASHSYPTITMKPDTSGWGIVTKRDDTAWT